MSTERTSIRGDALVAIAAGGAILFIVLGIRHAAGLFLAPISGHHGWGREVFGFAIALQNLVWGAALPFAGMVADKYGAPRVAVSGALLCAIGLWSMAVADGATNFVLASGVIFGVGLSGVTMPVVFGAVSRHVAPENRSMAMGITMAVGSFGQFVMLPASLGLINWFGWQGALVALSILTLAVAPMAWGLRAKTSVQNPDVQEKSTRAALAEAFNARDFWLLSIGFFACGFQVVFIAVHLPAYLGDRGVDITVATTTLALIGLFNIAGSLLAGYFGGLYRKPMLLAWIYLGRAALIAAFVLAPASAASAYAFGILMGFFWLSTIPLTNGVVASVWGVRHMAMLGGIVFFMHQLGAFAGGWFGGWIYDRTGSYDIAWGVAIAVSLIAAALNWPIRETPEARRSRAA